MSDTPGGRIRAERKRRGWSMKKLAAEVGCVEGTVKLYEAYDELPPKAQYAEAFERVLGIDLTSDPEDRDDPRLSRAPNEMLAAEVLRRMAGRRVDAFGFHETSRDALTRLDEQSGSGSA